MALQPNPWLVGTSLLFVIPTTVNAYYRQWVPYSASMFLMIASSLYHATKYQPILILDKLACYYLTVANLYYMVQHGVITVPISATIYCIYVFQYGYYVKSFVFAEDKQEALAWHISMHLIVILAVVYSSIRIGIDSNSQKLMLP